MPKKIQPTNPAVSHELAVQETELSSPGLGLAVQEAELSSPGSDMSVISPSESEHSTSMRDSDAEEVRDEFETKARIASEIVRYPNPKEKGVVVSHIHKINQPLFAHPPTVAGLRIGSNKG